MERIASDVIRENTIEYAKQILSNIFPNPIDGFKKVRRRIIYTHPTDRFVSGGEVVSNAIKIHPYSDVSIYDTACRLAEKFRFPFPPLFIDGKPGSYGGEEAAASRYTKFKLTDFCKDIFFNDINFKTIPTEITEDLSGNEIKYFIPKIPTALLYNNESIGFGYSSLTVPLKFENICDIAIDFISCKDRMNWNYGRLARLFLPLFSINVFIKNKRDIVNAYRNGNFNYPIETEGYYQIISSTTVLIRTLSYGTSAKMIHSKIVGQLKDKNSWLAKNECNFETLSEGQNFADFQLSTKRGGSVFELIDHVKKLLLFRTSISPLNNYVFNEKMFNFNPPDIINLWYKERYRSVFSAKKLKLQELEITKLRVATYLVVCDNVDEALSIIRSDNPDDVIFEQLRVRFALTVRQCEILLNSNLQILMRSKRQDLEERMTKIISDIKEINESFTAIDDEMIRDITNLKRKYKTDTTFCSKESEYIGCLLIENYGLIQVSSIEDFMTISAMFSSSVMRYIQYPSDIKSISFSRSNTFASIEALPYTFNSQTINIASKSVPNIFIRDNGRSSCIPNTSITPNKLIFNLVSDSPLVVMSMGAIKKAPSDLFNTKKYSPNVLFAFDPIKGVSEYVVISINEAHPNVIRFQKVGLKDTVMFSGAGTTAVIAVVPIDSNRFVANMPNFSKYNFIIIDNITKHLKESVNDINVRNFDKI